MEQQIKEMETKKSLGNKKKILIGAVIAIGVMILLGLGISNMGSSRLTKQLDLGQKYMEECDYEQAIVAFSKAIEIDERSPEGYIGLAETYIRMSEFDKALEIAKKGYELTGDERLQGYIEMIESGNISRSDGKRMKMTSYDAGGKVKYSHEYTYDEQGRESSVTHYDGNHNYVSSIEIPYDEDGNSLVDYALDPDSGEISKYSLFYQDGQLVGEHEDKGGFWSVYEYEDKGKEGKEVKEIYGYGENMGAEEEILGYSKDFYDSEGREIRHERYERVDGQYHMSYYGISEYKEEQKVKYSHYNADGILVWYEVYESHKKYHYDGKGNLEEYTIYEDGKSYDYDGEGNLKEYQERK